MPCAGSNKRDCCWLPSFAVTGDSVFCKLRSTVKLLCFQCYQTMMHCNGTVGNGTSKTAYCRKHAGLSRSPNVRCVPLLAFPIAEVKHRVVSTLAEAPATPSPVARAVYVRSSNCRIRVMQSQSDKAREGSARLTYAMCSRE